jgi:hypothetical protein
LRFDNVPSGWSGFSTERFSGWDIISTPVPNGKGLDFAGDLRYAFLIMGIRAKFF